MKSKKHIIVGSRRSQLAMLQSRNTITTLSKIHPDIEFELVEITTTGDRHRQISLEQLGGEGVFVKELEEALLQKRIDLAVHSAKDMPTDIPEGLHLAATPIRVDPRDVIVSRSGKLSELPQGAKVGTGSQRRAVQIHALRPDLQICGLRGNIDTRLNKVSSGEFDCILLAAAALIRLGLEDKITEYLSPENFVPAVGQGSLGIEARSDDTFLTGILSPFNDESTYKCVVAERTFLKELGGGCRAPIAASGQISNESIHLYGIVANPHGSEILKTEIYANSSDPIAAGKLLAQKLIEMGATSLVKRDEA